MKDNWVDFKEIKDRISMEMVLSRYGLLNLLKKSGNNLVGRCPIHNGSNPRQFSVNLDRNIFNCFGDCGSGGNVLDFVSRMEEISLRDAALLLKDWFGGNGQAKPKTKKTAKAKPEKKEPKPDHINPPLTFTLKKLKPNHTFFDERGIATQTVKHFGLGYCERGILKGRIAIPIHNEKNELVAYCGRAVNEKKIEEGGKYKMPSRFVKSTVVYNLNRQEGATRLVLVESFLSVFRLHQHGINDVVALMGSQLSAKQAELIIGHLGPDGKAALLFDADQAGRKCTIECLKKLSLKLYTKVIDIGPYAKKPHQLSENQSSVLVAKICEKVASSIPLAGV